MIAAIILVCSIAFLLQFFVSYCRSLIAASAKEPLPAEVQDVTGIGRTASADDFFRVVQLLHLCPERPEERGEIKAIGAYFRFLGLLRSTLARVMPSLDKWADSERGQCTHFAAVVLGRRIAFSRNLIAQQMDT
ncbi:MAG TPA: hypothetical protein VLV88_14370 [Terriglobales bacterium]|nr:hypothetical protein [Terriglobales bacterium]